MNRVSATVHILVLAIEKFYIYLAICFWEGVPLVFQHNRGMKSSLKTLNNYKLFLIPSRSRSEKRLNFSGTVNSEVVSENSPVLTWYPYLRP